MPVVFRCHQVSDRDDPFNLRQLDSQPVLDPGRQRLDRGRAGMAGAYKTELDKALLLVEIHEVHGAPVRSDGGRNLLDDGLGSISRRRPGPGNAPAGNPRVAGIIQPQI